MKTPTVAASRAGGIFCAGLRPACVVALLGFPLCGRLAAQAVPELTVAASVQVEATAEKGKVYSFWQSTDLQDWIRIGPDVTGDGGKLVVPAPVATGAPNGFIRMKVEDIPAGLAPVSLEGRAFLLNTGTTQSGVHMLSGTEGELRNREGGAVPFTWTWLRTESDTGECRMLLPGGMVQTLTLRFAAGNGGTWKSATVKDGLTTAAGHGTFADFSEFSYSIEPSMPTEGARFIVSTGEDRENHLLAEGVNWNWALVSGSSAVLTLGTGSAPVQYELTFRSLDSGECIILRMNAEGTVVNRSAGVFTLISAPAPAGF